MQITTHTKNSIIYKEREPAKNIYFIKSGEVVLSRTLNFFNSREFVHRCKNDMNCDFMNVNKKSNCKLALQKTINSVVKGPLTYFGEYEVVRNIPLREYQAQCYTNQCELYSISIDDISAKMSILNDGYENFVNEVKNLKNVFMET